VFEVVVGAWTCAHVREAVEDVERNNVPVDGRDTLETTNFEGSIIHSIEEGFHLARGVYRASLSREGIIVIYTNNVASVGGNDIGTCDEGNTGSAMVVVPFDIDCLVWMTMYDAHVSTGDATVGPPINHVVFLVVDAGARNGIS
jgi:hypothetical protein